MTFPRFTTPFLLAAALLAGNAHAQSAAPAVVEGAWARASVQGQSASGAFMRITAQEPLQLLRAETPAAGHAEVHEMKMDGGVMKMRALPALDLPAGQAVELKPGGYHIMLMDLTTQVKEGDKVPLTLTVENAKGEKETIKVDAETRALGMQDHSKMH